MLLYRCSRIVYRNLYCGGRLEDCVCSIALGAACLISIKLGGSGWNGVDEHGTDDCFSTKTAYVFSHQRAATLQPLNLTHVFY